MTRRPLAPLALCLLAALAVEARAAVLVPTKTADTADGTCDADCSLREAVIAANTAPGEDVILLHAGTYTIGLAGTDDGAAVGDLDVTDDLVIVGDGPDRTILDGAQRDRLLQVLTGDKLTLSDLTLRNGVAAGSGGGAIKNDGVTTLSRVVLRDNRSIKVGSSGGFGGAVYTDGSEASMTIVDSTVSGNVAQGGGGGLAVGDETTITNSTISGNRSDTDFGGGIYSFSSSRLVLHSVTIAANTAAQGGGGIYAESAAFIGFAPRMRNSILAGNQATGNPDCSGSIDSQYNLVGIVSSNCHGPAVANHDVVGTALTPVDAKLSGLAANGGPTATHALLAGSPAIEAGSPAVVGSSDDACPSTDQRGAKRPGGLLCDMGAYERTTECVPGGATLCLNNKRFQINAQFQAPGAPAASPANAVTLTSDSGYFTFFDPANVEITIKVLNGCAINNRYWVFMAGMTNVQTSVTVTDTQSAATAPKVYNNPQGRTFRAVLDTNAFATCP